MTDREKIIKGLECCTTPGNCGTCPWYPREDAEDGCIRTLMKAMLALLRAQEPEAVDAPKPDSDIGCWYDITHNHTLEQVVSALKAQEPRAIKNSAGNGICPGCGHIIPAWSSPNYCGYCGQAVKWK